jgi:hypothetical protein
MGSCGSCGSSRSDTHNSNHIDERSEPPEKPIKITQVLVETKKSLSMPTRDSPPLPPKIKRQEQSPTHRSCGKCTSIPETTGESEPESDHEPDHIPGPVTIPRFHPIDPLSLQMIKEMSGLTETQAQTQTNGAKNRYKIKDSQTNLHNIQRIGETPGDGDKYVNSMDYYNYDHPLRHNYHASAHYVDTD